MNSTYRTVIKFKHERFRKANEIIGLIQHKCSLRLTWYKTAIAAVSSSYLVKILINYKAISLFKKQL